MGRHQRGAAREKQCPSEDQFNGSGFADLQPNVRGAALESAIAESAESRTVVRLRSTCR